MTEVTHTHAYTRKDKESERVGERASSDSVFFFPSSILISGSQPLIQPGSITVKGCVIESPTDIIFVI